MKPKKPLAKAKKTAPKPTRAKPAKAPIVIKKRPMRRRALPQLDRQLPYVDRQLNSGELVTTEVVMAPSEPAAEQTATVALTEAEQLEALEERMRRGQ